MLSQPQKGKAIVITKASAAAAPATSAPVLVPAPTFTPAPASVSVSAPDPVPAAAPAPVPDPTPAAVPAPVPAPTPAAAPAPVPDPTPAPAALEPSAPAASEPAPVASEADKPAETAEAWTAAQDAELLRLKLQNKPWKEIMESIKGKSKDELRTRFKELGGGANQGGNNTAEEKGNGDGKGKQKGKQQLKGILKHSTSEPTQNVKEAGERPIIYVNEDDMLTAEDVSLLFHKPASRRTLIWIQLMFLYDLNMRLDKKKWLTLASRLFDKTGKSIEPGLLAEKLKNCSVADFK